MHFIVAILFFGCDSANKYTRIHQSAAKVLPQAVQMEQLFGPADHFITHFGFPNQKSNVWNSEVFFGGRYILTMQVDVRVDYNANTIVPLGEPLFHLLEVETIILPRDPSGSIQATFSRDMKLSASEWTSIYEKGGDFEEADITLLSSAVPGFDEYVRAVRAPRLPISLVDQ